MRNRDECRSGRAIERNHRSHPHQLRRSRAGPAFYLWRLPELGFKTQVGVAEQPKRDWIQRRNTDLRLNQAEELRCAESFDWRRVGFRQLTFTAEPRDEVDAIAAEIERRQ